MPATLRTDLPPDQARIEDELHTLDEDLAGLRARFDQFFLGVEKKNPSKDVEGYKKRLGKLRTQFIRNTAQKFRVNSLFNKFQTYERLWLKTLHEMEDGTYRRDIFRLRRKNAQADLLRKTGKAAAKDQKPGTAAPPVEEDLEADLPDELFEEDFPDAPAPPPKPAPAAAAVKGPPPTPAAALKPPAASPSSTKVPLQPVAKPAAPAAPRPAAPAAPRPATTAAQPAAKAPSPAAAPRQPPPPPPNSIRPASAAPVAASAAAGSDFGLSADRIKQIYSAYVTAKKRCKESTEGITPEAVAQSLRKQVPQLMKEPGVKSVDFKIVIKDGKAVLKAVPK